MSDASPYYTSTTEYEHDENVQQTDYKGYGSAARQYKHLHMLLGLHVVWMWNPQSLHQWARIPLVDPLHIKHLFGRQRMQPPEERQCPSFQDGGIQFLWIHLLQAIFFPIFLHFNISSSESISWLDFGSLQAKQTFPSFTNFETNSATSISDPVGQ